MLAKATRKAKNLTAYLVGQRVKDLRDEVRMRLFRFHQDRALKLPRALERIPVRTVYLFAEKSYKPDAPFDGELVLFRATSGDGPDEPAVEQYADPLLGWGRRVLRGVRVHDVAGGHSSMLQEPSVRALAAQIQSSIDRGLAEDLEPAASPRHATRQVAAAP